MHPRKNHARPPEKITHSPRKNHARPPPEKITHAPPEKLCTPPEKTTHAPSPPVNRITHSCKNITFPQLRLRAVLRVLVVFAPSQWRLNLHANKFIHNTVSCGKVTGLIKQESFLRDMKEYNRIISFLQFRAYYKSINLVNSPGPGWDPIGHLLANI